MQDDKYTTVMGMKIRYRQVGERGPDVLLIHGIYSSLEDWRANIEALSQNFRVWALDLPGCGLSDKPIDADYSQDGLATFMTAFMDQVRLGRVHVVGHSMGGGVALMLGLEDPDRISSVTVVAPSGVGYETHPLFKLATIPGLGAVITYPTRRRTKFLMRLALRDKALLTDTLVSERLALAKLPRAQLSFLRTLRRWANITGFQRKLVDAFQARLGNLRMPVLCIWGEKDRMIPASQAQILGRRVPDLNSAIYKNCGHYPHYEQADRFNLDLTMFLAGLEGQSLTIE